MENVDKDERMIKKLLETILDLNMYGGRSTFSMLHMTILNSLVLETVKAWKLTCPC
jgi:hypothetical protein